MSVIVSPYDLGVIKHFTSSLQSKKSFWFVDRGVLTKPFEKEILLQWPAITATAERREKAPFN